MKTKKSRRVFLTIFIVLCLGAISTLIHVGSGAITPTVSAQSPAIDPERSLLIRDLSVIEDPTRTFNPCNGSGTPLGVWTFGNLMTQLANEPVTGIEPEKFVRNWMRTWGRDQQVNGELVPARRAMISAVLRPWQEASGGITEPLDLSLAPFRLLAIVNRVDLNDDLDFAGEGAGEARFVFALVDPTDNCRPQQFTVNFEYLVKRDSCQEIQDWAQQWLDLSNFELGTEAYNAALEQVTAQFISAGADPTRRPNESTLATLVTNEIFLQEPWELRAFTLTAEGRGRGMLDMVPLKQTPSDDLNESTMLVDYVNENEADILARNYRMPAALADGSPLLSGAATMLRSTAWLGPNGGPAINSNEARHIMSLNTCSGCHARETGTTFTHIRPAPFGVTPPLSEFMTGVDVVDPADRVTVRHFNEVERRRIEFENILTSACQ